MRSTNKNKWRPGKRSYLLSHHQDCYHVNMLSCERCRQFAFLSSVTCKTLSFLFFQLPTRYLMGLKTVDNSIFNSSPLSSSPCSIRKLFGVCRFPRKLELIFLWSVITSDVPLESTFSMCLVTCYWKLLEFHAGRRQI